MTVADGKTWARARSFFRECRRSWACARPPVPSDCDLERPAIAREHNVARLHHPLALAVLKMDRSR